MSLNLKDKKKRCRGAFSKDGSKLISIEKKSHWKLQWVYMLAI